MVAACVPPCHDRLVLPAADGGRGDRRFNASVGVPPEADHETITRFFVTIVHERVQRFPRKEDRRALFSRFWRNPKPTLESIAARRGWVPPDLA